MQSTPPQTESVPQSDLPSEKKAYHSPNLRAAGSVREGTEASPTGYVPDGVSTPVTMYTGYYMSPI